MKKSKLQKFREDSNAQLKATLEPLLKQKIHASRDVRIGILITAFHEAILEVECKL